MRVWAAVVALVLLAGDAVPCTIVHKPIKVKQVCGWVLDYRGESINQKIPLILRRYVKTDGIARMGEVVSTATTEISGQFSFGAVPKGEYWLTTPDSNNWSVEGLVQVANSNGSVECKKPLYGRVGVKGGYCSYGFFSFTKPTAKGD